LDRADSSHDQGQKDDIKRKGNSARANVECVLDPANGSSFSTAIEVSPDEDGTLQGVFFKQNSCIRSGDLLENA
jgi:hypothetical protein